MKNLSQELKQFIKNSSWIFAKTYATTWPHEYIVQGQENSDLFLTLAHCIDSFGYESRFYETTQTYYDHDGQTYWHMENIINRCPQSETYYQREKDGRLPKNIGK